MGLRIIATVTTKIVANFFWLSAKSSSPLELTILASSFSLEAARTEHAMQVPLRNKPDRGYLPSHYRIIRWIKAAPFLVNPHAVLVHRIKAASTYMVDGKYSHTSVRYWCDNIGRGEIMHDVPSGMLLCARCEAAATSHGMPSAESLCGRHVHLGQSRAVQVCCEETQNTN